MKKIKAAARKSAATVERGARRAGSGVVKAANTVETTFVEKGTVRNAVKTAGTKVVKAANTVETTFVEKGTVRNATKKAAQSITTIGKKSATTKGDDDFPYETDLSNRVFLPVMQPSTTAPTVVTEATDDDSLFLPVTLPGAAPVVEEEPSAHSSTEAATGPSESSSTK